MIRIIFCGLVAFILSACVHVEEPLRQQQQQLAITSMFVEQVNVDEHSTYAFTPLQKNAKGARYPKITAEIENFLAERNITQVSPEDKPTFLVGYLLRKDEDYSDEDLVKTFGIDPGLPDLPELDKGTMLVFVLDGQSKQFLWRGAAQGFIIDDISEVDRKHRIEQLVYAIFGQFVNK